MGLMEYDIEAVLARAPEIVEHKARVRRRALSVAYALTYFVLFLVEPRGAVIFATVVGMALIARGNSETAGNRMAPRKDGEIFRTRRHHAH